MPLPLFRLGPDGIARAKIAQALIWLSFISALILAAWPAQAQSGPQLAEPTDGAIDLARGDEVASLQTHARYIYEQSADENADENGGITPNISLDKAIELARSGHEYSLSKVRSELALTDSSLVDGTYMLGPLWARIPLTNSGSEDTFWRIDTRDAYSPSIRAFAVYGSDQPLLILDNRWAEQHISQRVPHERLVASHVIKVPAGGSAEIWIDAKYGFSLDSELRLVREDRFISDRQWDTATASILFGLRGALLLGLLAFALILGDRTALYYAGFHAGLLLATLSVFGFDSFYLGLSEMQGGVAARATAAITLVFYTLTISAFLGSRSANPRYHRVLLGSALIGLVTMPILSVFDANIAWQARRPMVEAAVMLQFAIVTGYGIVWGVLRGLPGARWFLFASAMLLAIGAMNAASAVDLSPIAAWEMSHWTNFVFALDGFLFAIALVIRAMAIREQRDTARSEQLQVEAAKNALRDQLDDAQRDYQQAVELAEQRRRDLAATSHDLRQPLLSLQLALGKMEGTESAAQGVSYIEQVLQRNLANTRPDPAPPAQIAGFELNAALRNAAIMFEDEAAANGMRLSSVPTSARAAADPAVLMRILSNLVANAINHSEGSRILIGARRRPDGTVIQVLDNGKGLPPGSAEALFDEYARGTQSKGEGLGLHAVRTLAQKEGWTVRAKNLPSGGAIFEVGTLKEN